VTNVDTYDSCALLTLAGQGASNLGLEQQVLAPFERVDPLPQRRQPQSVGAARWRRACRGLIADEGPADVLRSPRTARIDLLPYQLEPALAIVRGHGSRVLIADGVGLGKTIQAGLVITELRTRGAAARVLVLVPAGLREQWADELDRRFNLRVPIFDVREASRYRSQLPVGANPWATVQIVIASLDYVKRPEVLPAVSASRWDLIVIDEAHHGTSGTDRHAAVSTLCATAAYVVLLTATPHSGDAAAFDALCEIGRHDDAVMVFRRTREDVGLGRPRRVHQLRVTLSSAERHMHACLAAFERAVQREEGGRAPDACLALATLRKRALSSAYALERSVRRRLEGFDEAAEANPSQLILPLDHGGDELDAVDAVPAWTIPALRDERDERALLTRLARAAAAASQRESKVAVLRRLLRRVREPMLIFTEYRDTLVHLRDAIAPEMRDAPVLHGGMTREERAAAVAGFPSSRILLATDAAGEGLNLHNGCRLVVNLELPWNPMRLEQRIGRVDRIGQARRVHAFHLIAAGTSETRILRRLQARVALAQATIGTADPLSSQAPPVELLARVETAGRVLPRLQADAIDESRRLSLARHLTSQAGTRRSPEIAGTEGPPPACALVTFARRREIRRELRGRILVVFQSGLHDETGRLVAQRLTPVLLRAACDMRQFVDRLDLVGPCIAERCPDVWGSTEPLRRAHDAFWMLRRDRERAIARWLAYTAASHEHQPGLFDRRADHELSAQRRRAEDANIDTDRRLRAIERLLHLTVNPPRPVLVLIP
jgi:superfamily II DNA or RNA helicase